MDSYLDFVLERLSSVAGNVSGKAMFGGYGIYLKDLVFGIVVDGALYLKVGESNIKDYIQAGMKPFSYEGKNGKPVSMSYWRLPIEILESNDDLPKWLEKAIQVSKDAKSKKVSSAKSKVAVVKKTPSGKKKSAVAKKKSTTQKLAKKKPTSKKKRK